MVLFCWITAQPLLTNWDWPDCSLEVIIVKNEVATFRVEYHSHFFVVLKKLLMCQR